MVPTVKVCRSNIFAWPVIVGTYLEQDPQGLQIMPKKNVSLLKAIL